MHCPIAGKKANLGVVLEDELWGARKVLMGIKKVSRSGIKMQTREQEWRLEPAENQAEKTALDRLFHGGFDRSYNCIIWQKFWSERSLLESLGSNSALTLICFVTSVPHISNRAKKTSLHSTDKVRSRTLALSTETGCPKVPRKCQFPYPLLFPREK